MCVHSVIRQARIQTTASHSASSQDCHALGPHEHLAPSTTPPTHARSPTRLRNEVIRTRQGSSEDADEEKACLLREHNQSPLDCKICWYVDMAGCMVGCFTVPSDQQNTCRFMKEKSHFLQFLGEVPGHYLRLLPMPSYPALIL